MSLIVPSTVQQKALLFLALLATLLGTVLLLTSIASVRWLVIEAPTRTTIGFTHTIDSNVITEWGLLRTCVHTPTQKSCAKTEFGSSATCNRSEGAFKARLRTTFAFLLLAFLVCVPLCIISFAYVINGDALGNKAKPVSCGVCLVSGDRKKGALIRLILCGVAIIFALISMSVYGNTISTWAGCGSHYCDTLSAAMEAQVRSVAAPDGHSVVQDVAIRCGYGFSFGCAVTGLVSLVGALIFILCEYTSEGSAMSAADADEEPQKVALAPNNNSDKRQQKSSTKSHREDDDRYTPQAVEYEEDPQNGEKKSAPPTAQHQNNRNNNGQQQSSSPSRFSNNGNSNNNSHAQQQQRGGNFNSYEEEEEEMTGQKKSSAPPSSNPNSPYQTSRHQHQGGATSNTTSRNTTSAESPTQSPTGARGGGGGGGRNRIAPQGEDWEFDENADLFWSPSQRLYFDEKSGHFFDPDSGQWYNPLNQQWYHLSS